jgi:NAD(P)-dependent dehydrogenase (short-subunit alcohol dehydrogenase family)
LEYIMQVDIRDKVIVVTGAARGLGRALALGLAAEGARVAVLARDEQQAARTVEEIAAASPAAPEPFGVAADVADEAQVRAAAAAVDARWGRVDALISNAGWMPPVTGVLDIEVSDLRRVVDSNLIGCFLTTKHFAPIMIRGGGGRIIYLSSMIGVQANPGQAAYGATKAGVNILANVAHRELADRGIRTVALAPGLTDTPGMRASVDEAYVARIAAGYPGGRLGQPEDVVSFAAFLCSDAASHLSGTLLPIRPVGG